MRMTTGDTLAAVSNAIAGLMHEYYGRGPESVKTYTFDDYLLVVMRGGLTTVEQTLLAADRSSLVRDVRQAFQHEMADEFMGTVAKLTGRPVVAYQSQIILEPVTLLEFFILEPGGD
jgi:uncharacterized protein YbcI